jgi:hypothetical protein
MHKAERLGGWQVMYRSREVMRHVKKRHDAIEGRLSEKKEWRCGGCGITLRSFPSLIFSHPSAWLWWLVSRVAFSLTT